MKTEYAIDLVIANVENAAGGFGITPGVAEEIKRAGVHILTSGNHIWDKKEVLPYIDQEPRLLRPQNFAPGVPGKGVFIPPDFPGVAVINLVGRVFMGLGECPFLTAQKLLENLASEIKVIVVDMHAEATSEKLAMGRFLAGKVTAVVGTHTHVTTADEEILPGGTGYITDVGMTGPVDSIIGIKSDLILKKFLTQLPVRFEVATGPSVFNAVAIQVDEKSGKALGIQRVRRVGEGT